MVRVFSTYHFLGQNIHIVNDDILTSCLLDDNHLILAKSNHIIEIRSIQHPEDTQSNIDDLNHNSNEAQTRRKIQKIPMPELSSINATTLQPLTFPTVDHVQQLEYCKNG